MRLFFTSVVRRLCTTQLFTYLIIDSATPLFTYCKVANDQFVTFCENEACDPEIRTRRKFLYNAPIHQVSSS